MKSIKISEEAHSRLVVFKAYLTLQLSKSQTFDDAIIELLDTSGSEDCRKLEEAK